VAHAAVSLATLRPGQRGRITQLEGDDAVAVRLLELGLLPGELVEVLGTAPFGDPLAVLIRGTRLAVRRCDAARIQILVSPSAAAAPAPAPAPEVTLA
jgi:Fe2+ transport system protein FeoA